MLVSALIGGVFALAGVAMGLGCWYAWRGLHPDDAGDGPADG